jgi:hypothetical protein
VKLVDAELPEEPRHGLGVLRRVVVSRRVGRFAEAEKVGHDDATGSSKPFPNLGERLA